MQSKTSAKFLQLHLGQIFQNRAVRWQEVGPLSHFLNSQAPNKGAFIKYKYRVTFNSYN